MQYPVQPQPGDQTNRGTFAVLPDSVNKNGMRINSWIGENAYNIDRSYELAALINSYAKRYGMDIMYLFGHDHSRSETELVLTEGDELISTVSYADRSTGAQKLHFTYAHSGYLSTVIGSADTSFSFIYRDGGGYSCDLIRTSDDRTRHTFVQARYVPEETAAAVTTAATAETTAASSAVKTENPKTGDGMNAVAILLPTMVLLLSRKRKNRE